MRKHVSTVEKSAMRELGRRVFEAHNRLDANLHRHVPYDEFALMVWDARGGKPVKGQYLSDYEKGKTRPSVETVLAIAKVCGVDPGWLAYGEDSDAPKIRGRDTHNTQET